MILKGERCIVRPWRREDVGDLVRFANNRKVWRNLMNLFPHPYTRECAEAWITACEQAPYVSKFAIELDGVACGGVGFDRMTDVHARTAKIGYWLGEPFWGRGIATEAARLVTEHVFATHPISRIQAGVFAWNPASARVLEKVGFIFEGRLRCHVFKDGELVDELVYALVR